MNPRAVNAQENIIDSFFDCLTHDNFSDITISEIAANADVSRKTFYRHFTGKLAVVEVYSHRCVSDYLKEVSSQQIETLADLLVVYFTFWLRHATRIRLLQKNNLLSSVLEFQRTDWLRDLPKQAFPWHQGTPENERFLDLLFLGGLWTIFLDALDTHLTPKELATQTYAQLSANLKYI